jgi:hypothetical protein
MAWDVIVGACVEPTHAVLGRPFRGQEDHGRVSSGPDRAEHVQTVEAGEHDVEEDDVRRCFTVEPNCFDSVARDHHVGALVGEPELDDLDDRRIVLYQQHLKWSRHDCLRSG